jgi:ATP-dependent Zn protease
MTLVIDKRSIALHEAAHAVVARVLGAHDVAIEMTPSAKGKVKAKASVWARVADNKHAFEVSAKTFLAGPVVEELAFPDKTEHWEACHNDDRTEVFEAVVRMACRDAGMTWPVTQSLDDVARAYAALEAPVKERAQLILDRLLSETEDLLREHWSAVKRVATVLLKADRMEQDELDRLIRGNAIGGGGRDGDCLRAGPPGAAD